MRYVFIVLVLAACQPTPPPKPGPQATVAVQKARIELKGKKASGYVFFTQIGNAIRAQGSVQDLKPAQTFGFHVHEGSDCKAAGADFNPSNDTHGGPADSQAHLGDLGNITAGDDGQAVVSLIRPGVKLDNGPRGVLGRVLVVHARYDDLKTQPDGDVGAAIACGVIAPN